MQTIINVVGMIIAIAIAIAMGVILLYFMITELLYE